jgi:hypothetical protein
MSRTVIGLAGVAGAGKDLFFNLLSKRMPVRRFALADKLKWECANWCYEQYDIDPLACSREEKEKIREFLVFHGTFKRRLSNGRHWIDKLTPDIQGFLLNVQAEDVPVVTDIRYQEYEGDEVNWLKKELGGVLIHVSQYHTPEHGWECEKYDLQPANEEEERMDPIIKENADFLVKWRKIKCDNPLDNDYLNNEVDKFVSWYNEKVKKEVNV